MIRTTMWALAGMAVLGGALAGCEDKGGGTERAPAGKSATTSAAATTAATATPTATASVTAATTATAVSSAAAKKYDCGAKDQRPCPMQGWMKRVMAPASSGGDADALAKALAYVAERPPPGFSDWTTMAKAGVAKAKAGDVDGAKASCKTCHDAYKETYQATMRDRPF